MITAFHHVAIATHDLERFVDHYRRWFGFEAVADGGWEAHHEAVGIMVGLPGSAARYRMLRLGSFHLEVFQYAEPVGERIERRMCDPGLTHLCLYVDDIDAEYARLRALGMTFHCPPIGGAVTRATYGRDCDGNVVELLQIVAEDHPYRLRDPITG